MIEHFLRHLEFEKQYSKHTITSYRNDLVQFCEFMQVECEEFDPNKVEESDIRMWTIYLLENSVSPRSVNRKLSSLKSFWRFCLKTGKTDKNALRKTFSLKTPDNLPTFYSKSELNELLALPYSKEDFEEFRNALIVRVFYETGLRRAELINLQHGDVDLNEHTLRIVGKRNKERIVPFGDSLREMIAEYYLIKEAEIPRTTNAYVFCTKKGEILSDGKIYKIVKDFISQSDQISCSKKSPHVLRHSFATSMLNNGADINAIKELLGHANLAATQIYTHTVFDEIKDTYKHAHPRA